MAVTNTPDKSEMKADELKSCPFCGKQPLIVCPDDSYGSALVTCGDANECPVDLTAWGDLNAGETLNDAIDRWNTRSRPPADQVPELVERLGETLHDLSDSLRQIGFFSGERKHIARYEAVVSAFENLAALQVVPAASEVREELGCDYCNNDGPLIEQSGWAPRCPRCDAEYPALKASGAE